MSDAFGYRFDGKPQAEVVGIQVAEGKHPSTLAPAVIAYVRFAVADDWEWAEMKLTIEEVEAAGESHRATEQFGLAMPPDLADELADQLRKWAARAREKHWDR